MSTRYKKTKIAIAVVLLLILAFTLDALYLQHQIRTGKMAVSREEAVKFEEFCKQAVNDPENKEMVEKIIKQKPPRVGANEYDVPVLIKRRHHVWVYDAV